MSATPAAVRILDLTVPVSGQDPVRAWLVASDDFGRPRSGVLWLHWLGHVRNDRGEFLPLAVDLAWQGVVSLLPMGHFPWGPSPDGTDGDVALVRAQVDAFGAALDCLAGQPGLGPARIALVGHDYGGMYGALLAERDERIHALALQAVDDSWGSWFSTYWLGLEGDARAEYAARFADLEPVDAIARTAERLGERTLLQWAGRDTYVTDETRAAYEAASPKARSLSYDRAEHQLDDHATADLVGFLEEQLGLTP